MKYPGFFALKAEYFIMNIIVVYLYTIILDFLMFLL